MSAICVIGMHRSGTSLAASLCHALGVNMGDDLLPPADDNPNGYYEDRDFYRLNMTILHDAGGSWVDPPAHQAVNEAGERLKPLIEGTVLQKQQGLWGWKDPRNCLTAHLYHPHLDAPKYVIIRRDMPDVVGSLKQRAGPQLTDMGWRALYHLYWNRVADFLQTLDQEQVLHLRYEDLTHPKAAEKEVRKLAAFLGVEDESAIQAAMDRIEYRDRWGFGSVAVGVPYFKSTPEFWLSWTHLLLTGLESSDYVLNNSKTPMCVRLPLAHNGLFRQFLECSRDTICLIEDDHAFLPDQLHRMRNKLENQQFDVVCASYTKRRDNDIPLPMGWRFKPEATKGTAICEFKFDEIESTGTQEYPGAAFGFTLIRRWVLEAMLDLPDGDPDPQHHEWAQIIGIGSPDVPFYWDAREIGARVGVDRDNWVAHVGSKLYTPKDFQRWWDVTKEGIEVEVRKQPETQEA